MTVPKKERLSWSRTGRPVPASERKTLLAVLRRAKREGRLREREPIEKETEARVTASRSR